MRQILHMPRAVWLIILFSIGLETYAEPKADIHTLSSDQLESRLKVIDSELSKLAKLSLRSGIGSLGYRSRINSQSENEWIEINWEQAVPINQIVIAPILWRDAEEGFRADGLPAEFRIFTGTSEDKEGSLLGEYKTADGILPRIAPFIIEADGVVASWIRIDIIRNADSSLFPGIAYQLSEIMVFSKEENVALRQPVKAATPSSGNYSSVVWHEQLLTDGLMPYRMDSGLGERSVAYFSPEHTDPYLTIDLGEPMPITQINLHAMDQGNTAPLAVSGNIGFPKHLRIEGASDSDFSDAKSLLEIRYREPSHIGPIMMWPFPETTCRYVRILAPNETTKMGFTEIELLSKGVNVSKNKPVSTNMPRGNQHLRPLSALTDGLNFYGEVLSTRAWVNELAKRHDLETERPLIASELSDRYARQKANLNRMSWLATLLAFGIVITFLVERIIRMRQIARIRTRFAADLHDELGANIHAIGLLSDLAKDATHSPEDLIETVDEIRNLTERTGHAIRNCTNMLQSRINENVVNDMSRTAHSVLVGIDYQLNIECESQLESLRAHTRADLLLFFKESLINISRHAAATLCEINVKQTDRSIILTISDNGRGLSEDEAKNLPASLQRRADLLGARAYTNRSELGGTCITLIITRSRFQFRK